MDAGGRAWTFGADVLGGAGGADVVLLCLHTPTGLGVNRTYWGPMFRGVEDGSLGTGDGIGVEVRTFDWVGTGDSAPKPDAAPVPYSVDLYVGQLETYVRGLGVEGGVVLLAQGAVEPIAVRFCARFPELVRGLIIANGLGTKYITQKAVEWKRKLSYSVLSGPFGLVFWSLVANANYIEGFSRKNLFIGEERLAEWVQLAVDGSRDSRVRFGVFAFISGFLFGDYTADFEAIEAPTLFLAGGQTPKRTIKNRMQSARPPVPIQVNESSLRDNRVERLTHRSEHIKNCIGEVVAAGGPDMLFESPELCIPAINRFLVKL